MAALSEKITPLASSHFIPYGRQLIGEDDVEAVVEVLRSDWLTTGPKVEEFEKAVSGYVGAEHGVAVSSGTAALHAAMHAIGIGPGDEVIVPAMTFAATANAVVYQGGVPVFADVDPETLLIDPEYVKRKITERTKAIAAVDYAGQPCDYSALKEITEATGMILIADACHALGAEYLGRKVGTLADLTVFSFHPVKHITTGEGGMIVTENDAFAKEMRAFRNHGIETDSRKRDELGTWFYQMTGLGFNYRITDIQCALGLSQLPKLDKWVATRRKIAGHYNEALSGVIGIKPLQTKQDVRHAYHLYVVRLANTARRNEVFSKMRHAGIGVNVHYIPVHLHPFYKDTFQTGKGLCPVAEAAYEGILSLPIHQAMTKNDVERVVDTLSKNIK